MIYVMSDIHGRIDRFESILRQIDLQEQDHLYVLGDVIDRNAGGVALMFRLLQMPNATLLLGNHEWMMRDCIVDGGDAEAWIINGGMETLMEYFDLSANQMLFLWDYLRQLPLQVMIRVNDTDYLLTHFMPISLYSQERDANMTDTEFAVWSRVEANTPLPEGTTLVFGHTPTVFYQDVDPMRVWHGDRRIGIDCGCSDPSGRLACLRLDDMKEFYSVDQTEGEADEVR